MAEKKLSAFRKRPSVDDLDEDAIWSIMTYGVEKWVRASEDRDWDLIAEESVKMFLANLTIPEICENLKVDQVEFESKVDVEAIVGMINGDIAFQIYSRAMAGNERFLALIADRKLGWCEKKTVDHNVSGELRVVPVLNVGLLTKDDEVQIRKEAVVDAEYVDVSEES